MSKRKYFVIALTLILVLSVVSLIACKKGGNIEVTFQGYGEAQTVSKGGTLKAPSVSNLTAGQNLLGWATSANAIKAKLSGSSFSYDELSDLATDGKLTLYPVIENKIDITLKGVEDKTTKLSDLTLNGAVMPLVRESARQQFLGWAKTENATKDDIVIAADATINYNTVKDLATDAKLTLYPVVESYDLMIIVHASHSNGNIYVSNEQFTEMQSEFNKALETYKTDNDIAIDVNVYWRRVDSVSAANFALEVVKKDYDVAITSKSIDADLLLANKIDTTEDPSATCLAKGYPMTALNCIDLNQSRQVVLLKSHDDAETYPYGVMTYNFFTTMIDKVITVKFAGKTETHEVHRATANEITPPDVIPPQGKDLLGWAFTENSTEVQVGSITYATLEGKDVDGSVTLYPVFGVYDLYVIVWGQNGNITYVTNEEYEVIKSGFNAYLQANGIDVTGKNVVLEYGEYKTEQFKLMLSRSYVHVAIGASALSNDDYATYWTYDASHFAQVTNVTLTNSSRYVALRQGAAENKPLSVEFFKYMCERKIEVTVKSNKDGVDDAVTELNSLTDTIATVPELEPVAGKELLGWATSENATEAEIAGTVIDFNSVASKAVNGKITLYPVYGVYDLYVLVWGQNGSNTYVTTDEFETIKSGFSAYLQTNDIDVTDKKIVFEYGVYSTDGFKATLGKSHVQVAIGASAMGGIGYAGGWTVDSNYFAAVANVTLTNTSRYVALRQGVAEDKALAVEFIKYMCETTIEVTVKSNKEGVDDAVTVLSNLSDTLAAIPELEIAGGKQLLGWTTDENGTEVEVAGDEIKLALIADKAVDGKVTLYPVFGEVIDLYVDILFKNISEVDIANMEAGFGRYLTNKGLDPQDYNIVYKYDFDGSGANFWAQISSGVDVIIAANNIMEQNGAMELYDETELSNVIPFTASSTRYLGILKQTQHYELAKMFYDFMTRIEVVIHLEDADDITGTLYKPVSGTAPSIVAEITPPTGKTLVGFATTQDATTAQITGNTLTIDNLRGKETDGRIELYPIYEDEDTETYDLVVYILSGNTKDYDKMPKNVVDTLAEEFNEYLVAQGEENAKYSVKVVALTAKAGPFNDAVNGATNVDVMIASSAAFKTSNGFAGYYDDVSSSTAVTGVENTDRETAIISTCAEDHYELAQKFVEFLTTVPTTEA